MELKAETINFFVYILLGIIIGIIFDFFRALRKVKKYNDKYIYIQDIIFFTLIGILLATFLIYNLEIELRVYLFFAIFLGIIIYATTISNYIVIFFVRIIELSNKIVSFIFLPLFLYKDIFVTIFDFFNKKTKKYCIMFYNMISYFYKSMKLKVRSIK